MKKGFTLIELLAVIILLGIIGLIIVPSVNKTITDSRQKVYNQSISSIEHSALMYLTNTGDCPTSDTVLSIQTLKDAGLLDNKTLENPKGGDSLDTNACIVYKWENNNYVINYITGDDCLKDQIIANYNVTKGVNIPQLTSGMTPIKWVNGVETTTTADDHNWYDYSNKLWANAKTTDGSYWVWIPRYAYKITSGWHTSTAGTIDIKFLKNDTIENSSNTVIQTSGYSTTGTNTSNAYFLEPAFQNGTGYTKYGFWVAKFEASVSDISDACYTSASKDNCNKTTLTPKFVPNVNSWRYTTIGNQYTVAQNMGINTSYGWSSGTVDIHMMTNYEWGAVAYLTRSSYGKNSEVWINNSSTFTTGCAGNSVSASSYSGCQNAYNTTNGLNASTTGNITGIYDMSGGAFEYVAAYVNNGHSNLSTYGSNIVNSTINKNIYSITTDSNSNNYNNNANIYGDALYETSNSYSGVTSWNSDYSYMPTSFNPWFIRDADYSTSSHAGVFAFDGDAGGAYSCDSFRVVGALK